jgi:putative sterol carrier protein
MADTHEFFNTYIPNKIAQDPDSVKKVNAIFQFDIKGAGQWTVDLTGEGSVVEGSAENADCIISTDKSSWEELLDNPSKALMQVAMRKLRLSDLAQAQKLQHLLS